MRLKFSVRVHDLAVWTAIVLLGSLLYAEHVSAHAYELNTRLGIEQFMSQLAGH